MTTPPAPDPASPRGAGPSARRRRLDVLRRAVAGERDLLALRREVQVACRGLGMPETDTVRLATVVSEVGRGLLAAPGLTGRLTLDRAAGRPTAVAEFAWTGAVRPAAGTLAAAERLLHRTAWEEGPFPRVLLGQPLPDTPESLEQRAAAAREELRVLSRVSVGEELRSQNHDLLQALQEARAQQEELQRLNDELERTNQGVMALYTELSNELETTNSGVVALHAELEETTRQLSLVNEAKTRFWANVSHELRSPVNDVIGLTRLLIAPGADPLTDEQTQQVSMIAASGSTLLALVEELLDVAKAESGRLEPELVPVDLRMLLHQLRGTLGGSARPGVVLAIPADEGFAPLTTDEVMLTRILRNVLSNSLKFTEHGEVRLTVERHDRAGGPWFAFAVSDTGVGIPAEEQGRVFEEFYQVRGPHQRARSGTGLGLPYARRLTSLLGGRMSLSSAPGAGTVVTVEIPAHPRHEPAPAQDWAVPGTGDGAAAARTAGDGPGGGDDEGRLRLRSLVIVDDDPVFLASVRPVLRELASLVTEVGDSAHAVRTIRRLQPDAVLLDLSMPPPDGYQLLAVLAGDPVLARLPVVVLTAGDRSELDRPRLAHARAVLGKTNLSASRLADVIAPALGTVPPLPRRQGPRPDRTGTAHPNAQDADGA
ncbi:ATP-binding response regulator [Actinacidiphila rubida]|uniref:histidine kinase n=1 Tax=Actinacidiphila rubida TaxID=310780 RepID=A0A1H8JLK5_9ACTN|nr:ATP-binding protein [Actinacidiphila rubida]SEN81643.1 Signal transduction histidine kinase [Actinacidiphila rubida]